MNQAPFELLRQIKHGVYSILRRLDGQMRIDFKLDHPRIKQPTKDKHMLQTQFTTEEEQNIRLNPVTDAGKPAKLNGVPIWTVVSGDVTLQPAADGLSCIVVSGAIGESVVQVDANADLDPAGPVIDLQAQITVDIIQANATNFGIVFDKPIATPLTPDETAAAAKASADQVAANAAAQAKLAPPAK